MWEHDYSYNEATMGWVNTSNFGGVSYKSRSWTVPNLIGYMEKSRRRKIDVQKTKLWGQFSKLRLMISKITNTALNKLNLPQHFYNGPGPK